MKLGDRRTVKPVTFGVTGADGKEKAITGTVVYIHPRARYCMLAFEVGKAGAGVTLRECFQLVEGAILQ